MKSLWISVVLLLDSSTKSSQCNLVSDGKLHFSLCLFVCFCDYSKSNGIDHDIFIGPGQRKECTFWERYHTMDTHTHTQTKEKKSPIFRNTPTTEVCTLPGLSSYRSFYFIIYSLK